jgi:hypothetical protein
MPSEGFGLPSSCCKQQGWQHGEEEEWIASRGLLKSCSASEKATRGLLDGDGSAAANHFKLFNVKHGIAQLSDMEYLNPSKMIPLLKADKVMLQY